MRPILALFWACSVLVFQNAALAQHLPEGRYHANRERSVDLVHLRADLSFNFEKQEVRGTAQLTLHPLSRLQEFSLDAIRLEIKGVSLVASQPQKALQFQMSDDQMTVTLDRSYAAQETLTVAIDYTGQPNAGMYFQKDQAHAGQYFVHTYGEGGLHANWLPIYSDVNDKFSSEFMVTVPRPYTVVSNGKLIEVEKQAGGAQTFHWKQELPHANYLMVLYVGEFEKGDLPAAFGSIPMSYWVPKGRKKQGAFAFRDTPKMVEFFSRRFNYKYPWAKYDQVAVPDYAIGAMEHTTATGHRASVLRGADAPFDFGAPDFSNYYTFWTAQSTISHELAHHWFGDNLTCRNLSYIWLNESFASYSQMLWDEERQGQQALLLDRQIALDHYLKYVATEHVIRPLEYHYFDNPDVMYNTEHTYMKGAIVLNLLRNILGDEDFFRALSYYLHKHEFSNVESSDFQVAIEEATGQNLDWFFDDWVYGGGHPVLEVSYKYLQQQKLVDLTVDQVQPMVEGEDLFTLPAEVTIATTKGDHKQTVWIENETEHFLLESDEAPLMVSFDGRGALVADVNFEKDLQELLFQIKNDDLPGQIGALRQLARRFPANPKTVQSMAAILSGKGFWGLKAEAALQLGVVRTEAAQQEISKALAAPDYRIRKAAVLALPKFGNAWAEAALKKAVSKDPHHDVVATAIVALARTNPENTVDFIGKQLGRASWYDEITIACLDAFKIIGSKTLVAKIKPFTGAKFNQQVRMSALDAWQSCAPEDVALHDRLMADVEKTPLSLQLFAIDLLGKLHVSKARPLLQRIAQQSGDENIRVQAEKAVEEIDRIAELNH
ncbi:MAG: M1 family aminopeptidase [bacterium]